MQLPKHYDFASIEEKWSEFWEKNGYFRPKKAEDKFVVMIPPPNVTGILHMGHVLNNTMQDIVVRFHRMKGHETLWQPGIDHAGIATHNKVEQQLAQQGLTRFDVGRERFLQLVWQWKEKYGGTIIKQLKKMGASCDWDNLVFTMDPAYSRAVLTAFVRLFEENLVYRDTRLINWCPRCGTALSDEEVEHHDTSSKLWFISYPLIDGSGQIIVATTRPETYLGDTGVAVHPEDPRFKDLIGKKVRLPLVNWKRKAVDGSEIGPEIPIIAHQSVDMEFGTGAVKITPAHDFNDYNIGKEKGLAMVEIMDQRGVMSENAGPYQGLDRYQARKKVVTDLEAKGFLVETRDYTVPLGKCYRCGTPVEPRLSKQWFINMKQLAQPAIDAVKTGRVRIIPDYGQKIFFHWMENIQDWCVSRQIWWGHRIPIYYCHTCGHVFASVEQPKACPKCGSKEFHQDEDVLDTWASSWLWPFATLGWPEQTPRLTRYYPGDVLITGWEILFFWVARMMMAGAHFMGDQPFHTVYLHGIVRDQKGRKFSKSLGNSPDPLDLFKKYSVDGVRMGMMLITPEGRDILFSEKSVETGRNFANKLWNAARFLLSKMDDPRAVEAEPGQTALEDRWIVSRLNKCILDVNKHLEAYEFNPAAKRLYDFFWSEFCDWFLEVIKARLAERDTTGLATGLFVLERFLRILHPFMPFITEELWQRLGRKDSIMIARWPEAGKTDPDAEQDFDLLREMVSGIREMRSNLKVPKQARLRLAMVRSPKALELARQNPGALALAGVSEIIDVDQAPAGSILVPSKRFEAYVELQGVVDLEAEAKRLSKELQELEGHMSKLRDRLNNPDFTRKAPDKVIKDHQQRLEQMRIKAEKLRGQLDRLSREA